MRARNQLKLQAAAAGFKLAPGPGGLEFQPTAERQARLQGQQELRLLEQRSLQARIATQQAAQETQRLIQERQRAEADALTAQQQQQRALAQFLGIGDFAQEGLGAGPPPTERPDLRVPQPAVDVQAIQPVPDIPTGPTRGQREAQERVQDLIEGPAPRPAVPEPEPPPQPAAPAPTAGRRRGRSPRFQAVVDQLRAQITDEELAQRGQTEEEFQTAAEVAIFSAFRERRLPTVVDVLDQLNALRRAEIAGEALSPENIADEELRQFLDPANPQGNFPARLNETINTIDDSIDAENALSDAFDSGEFRLIERSLDAFIKVNRADPELIDRAIEATLGLKLFEMVLEPERFGITFVTTADGRVRVAPGPASAFASPLDLEETEALNRMIERGGIDLRTFFDETDQPIAGAPAQPGAAARASEVPTPQIPVPQGRQIRQTGAPQLPDVSPGLERGLLFQTLQAIGNLPGAGIFLPQRRPQQELTPATQTERILRQTEQFGGQGL